jgi:hypothetical protein
MRVVGILTMVLAGGCLGHTIRVWVMFLSVWASVGCFGPDPAIKAALDQRAAQLRPSSAAYAAPKAAKPMPLKVGQWVQTKTVDEKGAVSLITAKLVGQEGSAFWQEIVTDTYHGRMVLRALIDFGNLTDPNSKKILRIQMKDEKGNVGEYPGGAVGFMQSLGPEIDMRAWKTLSQEDLQVLAGRFAQCYKGPMTAKTLIGTMAGTVWWHPAVPINGIVKSVYVSGGLLGTLGGTATSELVDFGLEGAKSEF